MLRRSNSELGREAAAGYSARFAISYPVDHHLQVR
jgi:hypothetical protein